MEDRASVDPGPQGWGVDDGIENIVMEAKYTDRFGAMDPRFYARQPAKAVRDEEALEAVKEVCRSNGIEGGMWLSAIESYVFGRPLTWLRQTVGSCVGSAFMRAATLRMLWESYVIGDAEEILGDNHIGPNNVAPFAPYGYRAGRKLANINRGDGSYCSVQIRGAKEYGILPCYATGLESDTFPEPQSMSLYREWGNSNSLLERFKPQALPHRLLESEQVRDASPAKELVTEHFKPIEICSMWAFRPDYTHPSWKLDNGQSVIIYKRDRSTSWAHAMTIVGIVMVAGKWFAIVLNSWGSNAHKNGDWFAIPLELLDEWLRDAEAMTIGDIEMTDNVLPGDDASQDAEATETTTHGETE